MRLSAMTQMKTMTSAAIVTALTMSAAVMARPVAAQTPVPAPPPAPPVPPSFNLSIQAVDEARERAHDAAARAHEAAERVRVAGEHVRIDADQIRTEVERAMAQHNLSLDLHDLNLDALHDLNLDALHDLELRMDHVNRLDFELAVNAFQRTAVPAPVPPTPPTAPERPRSAPAPFTRVSIDIGPMGLYEEARASINSGRYDRALEQLNRLIQRSDGKPNAIAERVDAAMYWKAYTQLKLASTADALSTLQDLQKKYSDSRWIKDARALELEARQASGQGVSPESLNSEELKLLALRGLMNSDPDKALPQIQQLMNGNSSVTVKENALFVLSQSQSPRARDIIVDTAKSGSNPDVQLRAIRYLGVMRSTDNRQVLGDVYKSSNDTAVKRAVIQAFRSAGSADALNELARSERDAELKRSIISSLGNMERTRSGDMLKSLYGSDSNAEVRKAIVTALSQQRNDTALIDLARAEKDPTLKRQMVTYLSNMKTKEATDYMIELLK